jgi:transposase
MIDRHWDGIATYCKPENKVSLGFVESLNNKMRTRLRPARRRISSVLTCRLPPLRSPKITHSIP